jgi:hypothetical protein
VCQSNRCDGKILVTITGSRIQNASGWTIMLSTMFLSKFWISSKFQIRELWHHILYAKIISLDFILHHVLCFSARLISLNCQCRMERRQTSHGTKINKQKQAWWPCYLDNFQTHAWLCVFTHLEWAVSKGYQMEMALVPLWVLIPSSKCSKYCFSSHLHLPL